MEILIHLALLAASSGIIWFCAGLLIESVSRIAKKFEASGFSVAFFVLGFLTSLSEISVAVNASFDGFPEISVGNLIGASFVILLLIVPVLAIAGNGIGLDGTLSSNNLLYALAVIALPSAMVLDGTLSLWESFLLIVLYAGLLYLVRRREAMVRAVREVAEQIIPGTRNVTSDVIKILIGAIIIFFAGHLLVGEASALSAALGVPGSLIGLILLSLGTNVPELVIAVRAILKKHKDIAFGDYLGSASINTLIFGVVGIANGTFMVEQSEFIATFILSVMGFALFYLFARTKNVISRREGTVLFCVYAIFFAVQVGNVMRFALD